MRILNTANNSSVRTGRSIVAGPKQGPTNRKTEPSQAPTPSLQSKIAAGLAAAVIATGAAGLPLPASADARRSTSFLDALTTSPPQSAGTKEFRDKAGDFQGEASPGGALARAAPDIDLSAAAGKVAGLAAQAGSAVPSLPSIPKSIGSAGEAASTVASAASPSTNLATAGRTSGSPAGGGQIPSIPGIPPTPKVTESPGEGESRVSQPGIKFEPFEKIKSGLRGAADSVLEPAGDVGANVVGGVGSAGRAAGEGVSAAGSAARDTFGKAKGDVEAVGEAADKARAGASSVLAPAGEVGSNVAGAVGQGASAVGSVATDTLRGARGGVEGAGRALDADQAKANAASLPGALGEAASAVGGGAGSAFRAAADATATMASKGKEAVDVASSKAGGALGGSEQDQRVGSKAARETPGATAPQGGQGEGGKGIFGKIGDALSGGSTVGSVPVGTVGVSEQAAEAGESLKDKVVSASRGLNFGLGPDAPAFKFETKQAPSDANTPKPGSGSGYPFLEAANAANEAVGGVGKAVADATSSLGQKVEGGTKDAKEAFSTPVSYVPTIPVFSEEPPTEPAPPNPVLELAAAESDKSERDLSTDNVLTRAVASGSRRAVEIVDEGKAAAQDLGKDIRKGAEKVSAGETGLQRQLQENRGDREKCPTPSVPCD